MNKKQFYIYGFIGVICLFVAFGRIISNLSEPGMGIWSSLISILSGLIILSAALLFLIWALLGVSAISSRFPQLSQGKGRFLKTYTVIPAFIVLVVIANLLDSNKDDVQAKELGFTSTKDFNDARHNNIFTVEGYNALLVQREKDKAAAEAQKIKDEALAKQKKLEEDAKCNEDVWCYIGKHQNASYECASLIPKLAKYKFEWTDGALEQKFHLAGWVDKNKHIVQTSGNRATAQNGFGATQNITYYCEFNADTGEIINYGFN